MIWDDGYYNIGKNFYNGESSLLHQYRTPGIPALLAILNIFPNNLQPFIRLMITQLFTLLNIYLAFKIFSKLLSRKTVIWGLIIALFNPLYLWWACLRSSPEIYITTFIGLIILFSLKLENKWSIKQAFSLTASIIISILFKPVLVIIPLTITISKFVYKKYKIGFFYLFVFTISLISFKFITDISKPTNIYSYGVTAFMGDLFLTQSLIDSGKLGYYIGGGDVPESVSYNKGINQKVGNWVQKYSDKNPTHSELQICIDFFKENFGLMLLSKLLSPLYFISIADTTDKSIFNLIINLIILFFSIKGVQSIKKKFPGQIILILYIFIGYYLMYFLTQSCARYYIPISFYLSVFAGYSLENLLSKYSSKTNVDSILS